MREYEDITSALRAVQRNWQSGYTCWVTFIVGADKVPAIGERWAEELGTGLPAWKRQDRKQRRLANAVALSSPVLGRPGVREIVLMATPDGKRAGNAPRELEAFQRDTPGCQRCGSNSSIRPAGCVGSRVSTSLM